LDFGPDLSDTRGRRALIAENAEAAEKTSHVMVLLFSAIFACSALNAL